MRQPLSSLALALPLVLLPAPDRPAEALSISAGPARCLAVALYFEAQSEGREGMEAVAAVVINRVRHPEFPNDVCAVVTDGGEQPPCQFSWWCDGKSDRPREVQAWQDAQIVARDVLENDFRDPTGGALFFHTTNMRNPWKRPRQKTTEIGRHVFYR